MEYFYRELQPYPKGDFVHIWLIKLNLIKGFNPYTPSSDKHVTSPCDIHTLSTKHEDIQTYQVKVGGPDLSPNSWDLFTRKCVAAREEN